MDLDTYLREVSIDARQFAAQIGMTEASLSRIRRGQQNITRDTMKRIIAASGGKVTLESLVFPHAEEDAAPQHDGSTGQIDEESTVVAGGQA